MTERSLPTSKTIGNPTNEQVDGAGGPADNRRSFAKAFLKLLSGVSSPMSDLKSLRGQAEGIVERLLGERVPLSKTGRLVDGGRMTLAGALVYWTGFAAGVMNAPLGLLIGVFGSAGLISGYQKICQTRRDFEFLRTYYSCLLLMEQADNIITELERKQMDAFLESLPITEKDKAELQEIKIKSVDEIEFPNWFEFSQARMILTGCCCLSYCDGIAAEELAVFQAIGEKLGVNPKELKTIRQDAMQAVDALENDVLRMGLTSFLLWPGAGEHRAEMAELLSFLSVRNASSESIQKALSALEDDGERKMLLFGGELPGEAPLAAGYTLCRTLADDAGGRRAGEIFLAHCRRLERESQGREFLEMVDGMLARCG